MITQLKPLNIYKLDGKSLIDCELKSYGNYIDTIDYFITNLFNSCFIDNISYSSISKFIKLFALPNSIFTHDLKTIIKRRIAIDNTYFTMDGVKKCILAGGFTATITENFVTNTVTVNATDNMELFLDDNQKKEYIKQCLPCHVNSNIIIN